jgi:hypothetical protein
MDRIWWEKYAHIVKRDGYSGELVTCSNTPGINKISANGIRFSGAGAIMLALQRGAARVILLGYDCYHTGGRAHWHADHPKGMGNAGIFAKWPRQMELVLPHVGRAVVLNASRTTMLECFKRVPLEVCL